MAQGTLQLLFTLVELQCDHRVLVQIQYQKICVSNKIIPVNHWQDSSQYHKESVAMPQSDSDQLLQLWNSVKIQLKNPNTVFKMLMKSKFKYSITPDTGDYVYDCLKTVVT